MARPGILLAAAALALAACGAASGAAAAADVAAASREGAALFRAGRFREAAERYREAVAADPDAEAPRRSLAASLAAAAAAALRDGRPDEAAPLVDEALRLDGSSAALHALRASVHLVRGDLYEARVSAERAVDLAPADPAALELLGDIDYREGYLDRARRLWERAAAAAAGPRAAAIAARLARLEREADAERDFDRDVSRHFTIQYDGTVPAPVAARALRLLEETYDRLWREFRRAPRSDIPVLLTSRVLFVSITGSAPWVGGVYDGKIRIPVGGLQTASDADRLAPVLAHELTHAFLRANVAAPLPLWFEEGLASYLAGEAHGPRPGVPGAAFPTLDALDAALRGGPGVGAAYAAAAAALEDLVRLGGAALPRRIVESVGQGVPFPEAFRRASGISLERFEERRAGFP